MDTSQPGAGEPDTGRPLVVTLTARPGREEVARLCARLAAAPPAGVVCEAGALVRADLAAVDALARLGLAAARHGHRIRFRGVGPDLRVLLRLAGLEETLGL
ncbi:STAS domain-containing protein [Streptomyces sp. NPDC001744]|uniref:STAS domain-containing protein n=1 Tax=Streptomyces sp. NPDC001744 TaxID=3364606 RepID=UPI003676BFB5